MFTQNLAILLAITGTYASPITKRDECSAACSATYNTCRGQPGANRATCASEFATCLGYLPFDSAGSLVTPTACSTAAPAPTSDACATKCNESYNACRGKPDANRATCASEFADCLGYLPFDAQGSLIKPTACSSSTAAPSITGIPGGCNPAHPGSCPDSYFSTTAAPAPAPAATQAPASGAPGWTIKQLTRYCAEDGTGCDYNFAISTNDGSADQRCTIIRTNVGDALTESWYDQECTTGSAYRISWGYSTQFETPFAVLTAVNTQAKAQAYFGVNNPNGQEVTPSNPKGSGNFGDIGPQPVYTF